MMRRTADTCPPFPLLAYLLHDQTQPHFSLIGPMGAGKTTIGKQLAQALGMTFGDSDQEIQRRTGVDIPTIFEYEGEEGFRQREQQAIDDLTQVDNQVLATGGRGHPAGREPPAPVGARRGVLPARPEQQFERTYRDRNRPLCKPKTRWNASRR